MKRAQIFLTLGIFFILGSAVWGLVPSVALGAVPQLINFQGVLKTPADTAVSDGSYSVIFTVYNAPAGGTVYWAETTSVTTAGGLFSVLLGSLNPVPESLFFLPYRYLGIKVGADPEMSPRQQLSSVGYSYVSSQWTSAGQNLFRLNGNVGIGTTNPIAKLEVAGQIRVQYDGQPATLAIVTPNASPGNIGGTRLIFVPQTAATQQEIWGVDGSLHFRTGGIPGTTTASTRMAINSSGNVGIGTTSPTEKLHVVGNICATGTIGACSDARFKRSLRPIEGALGKIEKLQGVTYQWNREKYPQFAEGNQIGFVAQEVRGILPEVVSEGSDGTLSVDYGRFSVLLLEAMKEQQKQIEELKETIKQLKENKPTVR